MKVFKTTEIRVHPRIRGEYIDYSGIDLTQPGSPPHSRGIILFLKIEVAGIRLTPAFAGNTLRS